MPFITLVSDMLHQTPSIPIPILLPSRRARGILIVVNTMLTVAGYLVSPCLFLSVSRAIHPCDRYGI